MRPALLSLIVFLAIPAFGAASFTTDRAEPFPLNQVKLLDGPFKHATELDHQYLLKLEPDRFLAWFRKEAGLQPRAAVYGGWESQGVAGHCLGHYLSACSQMYQTTGDQELRRRVDYIVSELDACQKANGNGYVAAIPRGKEIFAEVARGDIRSKGFDLNGGWVPWYTMHKVMAGLRDSYQLSGNLQALLVLTKLADWAYATTRNLTPEQWQTMLACEHGGMNEVLADLYGITGDMKYLSLSRKFHHRAVLDALAARRDELNGKHANTQIPKLIGLAERYDLADEESDRVAADFFWERVAHHHSYVTGGHCIAEHFGPPDKLNDRLGPDTTETCNVYNMLKLTEHVFGWRQHAGVADFYERALYNHILASQHPRDGRVIYNLSLAMGGAKVYQDQFNAFTCCVGTGMENHAKYGRGIYFHTVDKLFVNLFIPSEVNWAERGIKLRQQTEFPDRDTTTLIFDAAKSTKLTLAIRYPYWAEHGAEVTLNGKELKLEPTECSYLEIRRTWERGDSVHVRFPMALRLETMPDNRNRAAIMYGPIVLAGELGEVNDPAASRPDFVPVLLTSSRDLAGWVKPENDAPLRFKTEGVGRPRDFALYPFFRMHDKRYSVYWDFFTESEWQAREAAYKAEVERLQALEARTVDVVRIGEMQPERDHNLQGENTGAGDALGRKWRHATDGGWFSFELKVVPAGANILSVTYWGSDAGNREFDVLVDGQKVASERLENNNPGKFYDQEYKLPESAVAGKQKVTVKFQAHPGKWAGGVFGARMLKAE